MFRQMRRARQLLPEADCAEILRTATSGVLAVNGDGGYPYAVPLNFVYDGDRIYFHCAVSGHKLDAIKRDSRVSFCVVGMDVTVPERFTSHYKSVIVFGRAEPVTDEAEKRSAIEKLAAKYSPDESMQSRAAEIDAFWDRLVMLRLSIEHISGKQAKELVKQ